MKIAAHRSSNAYMIIKLGKKQPLRIQSSTETKWWPVIYLSSIRAILKKGALNAKG